MPRVIITLGDPAGIGPEVMDEALRSDDRHLHPAAELWQANSIYNGLEQAFHHAAKEYRRKRGTDIVITDLNIVM